MNPQIEQLRRQFNGYNTAQKKQFIDNLKVKLQGNKSPEYAKFLNECIQTYNTAVKNGVSQPTHAQTQPQAQAPLPTASTKQKNPLKVAVIIMSIVLAVVVVGGVGLLVFNNAGGVDRSNEIIGYWHLTDHHLAGGTGQRIVERGYDDFGQSFLAAFTEYVFSRDGTYVLNQFSVRVGRGNFISVHETGTFEVRGNTLTLFPSTGASRQYDFNGEWIIRPNGNIFVRWR